MIESMKICSLSSGSHGNSTYIKAGKTEILLDAGTTLTTIEKRLKQIGADPGNISAIFLTHEHFDHIKGAKAFSKKHNCKIFVHQFSIPWIMAKLGEVKENVFTFTCEDFYYEELTVSPFKVSHDSMFCVGFSFYHQQTKFSAATDIGEFSFETLTHMEKSDLVFIESNHDEDLLLSGNYHSSLKRRIKSKNGHLSNRQAAEAVVELAKRGTRNFVLCHLSEKNNTSQLAADEVRKKLKDVLSEEINVQVARRNESGPVIEI